MTHLHSMKESQLSYWISYPDLENSSDAAANYGKGWITHNGAEDPLLVAHLHLIANIASDRAEMHSTIAQQRDSWNKLFQSSFVALAMAATVLSSLSGYAPNLCFSLPACGLNTFLALAMAAFNRFQPSQLAEEQRTAARECRRLASDVKYMLRIAPQLRQYVHSYVEEAAGRLYAVDKAYPLPLTPMVVERFPKEVRAPVLSMHADNVKAGSEAAATTETSSNGWELGMGQALLQVGELMVQSDAIIYKRKAESLKKMNRVCAVGSPLCVSVGAAFNLLGVLAGVDLIQSSTLHVVNVGVIAAMLSTLGAFATIFAHDAQLGMIFELFRSTMGYFEEINASIKRALALPVSKRENGILFKLKVAYELGHRVEDLDTLPTCHKTAGALF